MLSMRRREEKYKQREFGKDDPVYMHSSAPFVQAQTLNRVLKLCAKHSGTEMQSIQTHIQHCENIVKIMMIYENLQS